MTEEVTEAQIEAGKKVFYNSPLEMIPHDMVTDIYLAMRSASNSPTTNGEEYQQARTAYLDEFIGDWATSRNIAARAYDAGYSRANLTPRAASDDDVERVQDWWKPDPEDPFWMLEAEDGEWLKNEHSLLGTRDPAKALRFPTERDALDKKSSIWPVRWWCAKATEHSWIAALSTPTTASAVDDPETAKGGERTYHPNWATSNVPTNHSDLTEGKK